MPSFGENLRREREMRGVTLEEISESTKISTRLLQALEADQFSDLPGGIFTRNFIRAYAQYLGLDEEHALSEYKRAAGSPVDNDLTRLAPNKTLSSMSGSRGRLLPWVVIAVLLGSGYAVYRYSHRNVEVPAAPTQAASTPSTNTPAANTPAVTAPPGTAPAGPAGTQGSNPSGADNAAGAPPNPNGQSPSPGASGANSAGTTAAPSGSAAVPDAGSTTNAASGANDASAGPELGEGDLVLQVSTSEESWIAVAADGKTLWQHALPANSTRRFRAKDFFDVTTGNAQGTSLTLNGQAQKSLGREGEFRRVHLTRDNLQAQAPHP